MYDFVWCPSSSSPFLFSIRQKMYVLVGSMAVVLVVKTGMEKKTQGDDDDENARHDIIYQDDDHQRCRNFAV